MKCTPSASQIPGDLEGCGGGSCSGAEFGFKAHPVSILSFTFVRMRVLPACIWVHHVCAVCSGRIEEGTPFLRTGVMDNCEGAEN